MTIRDAVESDLPDIVGIYNASIPGRVATSDTEPITVESRAKWFARHDPVRRPLLVGELAGRVVGYCSFRNFYGRPAYYITAEIAIYVDPAHHRKGFARALISAGLDRARAADLENVLAFVFAHNPASLALFQSFGFTPAGRLPAVANLDGRRVDLVILQKRL
ncbi:MAG: GNAT family N-acetyltransferase [Planctomycetes bacterium]|nr:GNAT family N-acetyltransferase [Planctomycetota bacterium]